MTIGYSHTLQVQPVLGSVGSRSSQATFKMLSTLALMSMPLLLLPLLPLLPPLPRLPLPLPPLNAAQLPVHVVLAPTTTVLQVVRLQPAPSVSIPHHCEKPYGK